MRIKKMNEYNATEEVNKWWDVISSDNKANLKKKYNISGDIDETQIYKIWKAEIVEPNQVNLDQTDRMTQENKMVQSYQYCNDCGDELILDDNDKYQCTNCLGKYDHKAKLDSTKENSTYVFDKENFTELTKFLKSYNLCQAQKNNTTHILANEILRILKIPNNIK